MKNRNGALFGISDFLRGGVFVGGLAFRFPSTTFDSRRFVVSSSSSSSEPSLSSSYDPSSYGTVSDEGK